MLQLPPHHSDYPSRLHHHPTEWPLTIHCRLCYWDLLLAHSHGSLRSPAQIRNLETIPQLNTALRPYTLPHRSPPSRSSPAVAAVLSPVSSPGPPVSSPVSSPPDSVATRRFSSRPHHLFNVFLESPPSQNFAMLAKQRWRTSIGIYSIDKWLWKITKEIVLEGPPSDIMYHLHPLFK